MRTSRATCWPSLVCRYYFLDESSLDVVLGLVSSSLRTGNPLPQVTPCPLLNRFMDRHHGLNIVHEECEDDFGLPKVLTEETLESLQYLYVTLLPSSVASSTSPCTASQDFQCRRVDCVWYRDTSGQADGRGQGSGRGTIPYRRGWSSTVFSPRARGGDAFPRSNINDPWVEPVVKPGLIVRLTCIPIASVFW
jgi:hypothetical protein